MLKTLLPEIEKLKNENKHTKQALAAVTVNRPDEASTSSKHAPSSSAEAPPVDDAGSNATQAPTVENEASSSTQTAQVVYVSRERKIKKFSGDRATDEDTVEDFVDNVKSLISARKMTQVEQTDYVLSLLESAVK